MKTIISIGVSIATILLLIPKNALSENWANGIGIILALPDAIERSAEFVGWAESVDQKIEKLDAKVELLLRGSFRTACDLLDQAHATDLPDQKSILLNSARLEFTKSANQATDDFDLAIALLGLWHCCDVLGDQKNALQSLIRICEINSTGEESNKKLGDSVQQAIYRDGIAKTLLFDMALQGKMEAVKRGLVPLNKAWVVHELSNEAYTYLFLSGNEPTSVDCVARFEWLKNLHISAGYSETTSLCKSCKNVTRTLEGKCIVCRREGLEPAIEGMKTLKSKAAAEYKKQVREMEKEWGLPEGWLEK